MGLLLLNRLAPAPPRPAAASAGRPDVAAASRCQSHSLTSSAFASSGVRSVERWRRAWREGGMAALRSTGPANSPTVTDAQFAVLEAELGRGPTAHGFEDERWTLVWVQTVIRRRLRVSLPVKFPLCAGQPDTGTDSPGGSSPWQ
ncbi:IS630 family transposase [Streptomyces sp. Mg1]|nr:IS630 family transposase [Streptomyces sp. Mg1]